MNDDNQTLIKGDPNALVMYSVVRISAGMSTGKVVAQGQHAAFTMALRCAQLEKELDTYLFGPDCGADHKDPPTNLLLKVADFKEWYGKGSQRKIVLGADDKEWEKVKAEFAGKEIVIIQDAGLTQLEPGTETVIMLFPMRKNEAPACIKRLQCL